ncbi:MAG: UDP-N-acetylglucosamine 1-carboxyvinyltransferase [Acidimicrobiales bacterium]|nr:UDP-N-acetylglucosamine 1-carboxyvinyltransferase [Acidimicrobiales bacterium]
MSPPDVSPSASWAVEPSGPLRGEIRVSGSKNAITKHMVAAIMGHTPSTITNVPDVGDVGITTEVLESLGVGVDLDGDTVTITPADDLQAEVPVRYSGLNRIPILLLGPLLHLRSEAFVPVMGGDRIGARPVDFHVEALRSFGAEVVEDDEGVRAKVSGRLQGTTITLPYPSVGATESVLLTAAMAEGRTVLRNAATEPEIIELALFLQRMGARLELQPGRRFLIEGVEHLHGARTALAGDRLEAFSYLVAGLATGGEVRVAGCHQDRMVTAISTLQRMGAEFDINDAWLSASAQGLHPVAIHTDTHPGFMTDWQSPLFVLMTQAEGMSVLHETVFEDRVQYPASVVAAMGGEIELFDTCLGGPDCRFHDTNAVHSAVVRGVSKLRGAHVEIPDVRAGFSGVIAAAAAEGSSVIGGVHHLERGYNRPFETFEALGLELRQA